MRRVKWRKRERLFDRFYKADSSRTGQGTGLGLSIASLLVEKMKGSITAHVNHTSIIMQLNFMKYKRFELRDVIA